MAEQLNLQDIQNILTFMGRAEMKGAEAHAYMTAEVKLQLMAKQLKSDVETAGGHDDGDGSADTTS